MSGWTSLADRHWQTLAARIEKEHVDRSKQLAQGYAKSFEDYANRVGYLTALRDVGAWSAEVIRSMDAKPPMRDA